jgi:hypothetical protein
MKVSLVFLMTITLLFSGSCEKKVVDDLADTCENQYTTWCYEGDVHLFNHCGDRIGIVIECLDGEKCEIDACLPCEVTSDCAKQLCYEGDVYCYNNCGRRTTLEEKCPAGKACWEGKCIDCSPTDECAEKKCYDGNVYCYTDCGPRGKLHQTCNEEELCVNGECEYCETTDSCESRRCENKLDIYCYDNCGRKGDIFEECEGYDECIDGECKCIPDCEEKNCGPDGCGGLCGECSDGDDCLKGVCTSPVDFEGPEYFGNILLIVNTSTNGKQSSYTGTLSNVVLKGNFDDNEPSVYPDLNLFSRPGIYIPEDLDITKLPAPAKKPVKVLDVPVDTVEEFWLRDVKINATLQHSGEKCQVWAQDTASTTKTKAKQMCDEFDNVIHPLVTINFHEEPDINGDGKVAIMIAGLDGPAGFFNPGDLYSKQEYYYSNARDMIYVEKALTTADMRSTIVHEFQHLCYANRNMLIEGDHNYFDLAHRWIDEGLAMAAQHMYEGTQQSLVHIFNTKPYNDPVAEGNGFFDWDTSNVNRVYSDYALSYIFFQYLRLQAEEEEGLFRDIILNAKNDWRSVEDAIKDRVDPAMSLSDFMVNFRIAMLLNKKGGPFGFMSEPGLSFVPRFYTGTGKNLEGGGALYVRIKGSFKEPSDKGQDIVYIGIDYPG